MGVSSIDGCRGLGSLHSRMAKLVTTPVQVHPFSKAVSCLQSDLQVLTEGSMLCRPSMKQAAASCWQS